MKHVYHVTALVTYRTPGTAPERIEEEVSVLGNGDAFVAGRRAARILKRLNFKGENGQTWKASRVVVSEIKQGTEVAIR